MVSTKISILGYHIGEQLYEGSRNVVYRAYRETDQQPVVIKLLKNPYPSFVELVQFRNQYTIAKNLNLPGIIEIYSLEAYQNGYALVMEDYGGISLQGWTFKEGTESSLIEFLLLGISLCDILNTLIRHRIIHKDIKPANILIHPKTREVKLIDFSISSLLPRETQTLMNPNVLEGTLSYLSPEQTGRMNRGIDYRTDFYSLGVTFYELLTGKLPFQSDDAMELVHCHIAKHPDPFKNETDIPQVLCDIVMKLMAKNAEDRYQSALGLKYDLETCLEQLKKTGKIEYFPIGRRDMSDRFLIPEKLYGRENEVETLLEAFDRVTNNQTELMLVAGFSGIGKTAIINEVHKPIVEKRGYFIKGKFDQFNRNTPFSAFVQAFRDLMGQLLSESDTQLSAWKTKIIEALSSNGQVIVEVIPELEQIIGKQPPAAELSGTAAQNLFNLLLKKFIQVFTTKEHPLVIFLDDLQWADSASLKLMQLLMSKSNLGYLLLIGAYRDNEVFAAHPLMLTLDEIGKTNAKIHTITLAPLGEASLNQLVADTLNCSPEVAQPLTQLIYQKTKGNPFFSTQFLKVLHDDGLIEFNLDWGMWQCDIAKVKALALSHDVVEFMALQLQKLPTVTQNVLKLAACIGNQFDLATLGIVCEKSETETAADLWKALQEGLIIPQSEIYKFYQDGNSSLLTVDSLPPANYRFLHDRVQQAAYALIPENLKQATHLKIGGLLLDNIPLDQREDQIFAIVHQINLGQDLLITEAEWWELAQLNLQAGQKAKLSTAYNTAREYLRIGMVALPESAWIKDYALTFTLHRERAEVEYLCSQFEQAEALYPIALANAQTLLDRVAIYLIQMNQYQIQGRYTEAIEVQRTSLARLGWEIDLDPSALQTMLDAELQAVTTYLGDNAKSAIADLLNHPHMQDPEKSAWVKILQAMFYTGYLIGNQTLACLSVVKMTTLSLQYGNDEFSPFGYVGYGLVVNGLGNYEIGGQFGEMAVKLSEQFDNNYIKCQTNFLFAADVHNWSRPIQEADIYYDNAYRCGLESGDWVTIGYMIIQSGSDRLTCGKNLDDLYQTCQAHLEFLERVKNYDIIDLLYAGVLQPLLNLKGLTDSLLTFDSHDFSEAEYLEKYCDLPYYLAWFYYAKIRSAYWFDDRSQWANLIDKLAMVETYVPSHSKVPETNFYVALMHLALCDAASESERELHLKQVQIIEEKLQRWAKSCPENILQKLRLVQAEKARILGERLEAMDLYDEAIKLATKHDYINNQSLANELAAKFYLGTQRQKVAQAYMQEAYYCYARWGAKAKTDDLEKLYPQLLESILQQKQLTLSSLETITALAPSVSTNHQTMQTSSCSSTNISAALDFATILKVSQALSCEIQLDKLLISFLNAMIANAGASKCVLILARENHLRVEAIAQLGQEPSILQALPIDQSFDIPVSLIYTVKRSLQSIVIDDASKQTSLMADPYIRKQQPKSLLCNQIVHQGKLLGILYLENNLTTAAFTPDRLEIVRLLSSQAAISIENATLYNTLEQKVTERTQQLSQALEELKTFQDQLVESKKMAALASLVSGVAHEINTPVGTSITLVSTLVDHTTTLMATVEQGQVKRSNLTKYLNIARECGEITLINLNRAAELVQSFKQVAVDQANLEQRTINIKAYLKEILLSLAPSLKQTAHTMTITADDTVTISTYPGALAQVITNLVINSLIHAYQPEEAGHLHFEVLQQPNQVVIQYSDDGCGIPEENLNRIFEPFFTTARHRGGTGLGLHIVYNLVTQKMRGRIDVQSEAGKGTLFKVTLPLAITINYEL